MDRDTLMSNNGFMDWDYSLMYDTSEKEYIIAEVYFNKQGDPVSWCVADIANTSLKEMDKILKRLVLQSSGGLYFVSNAKGDRITKHKGRAS